MYITYATSAVSMQNIPARHRCPPRRLPHRVKIIIGGVPLWAWNLGLTIQPETWSDVMSISSVIHILPLSVALSNQAETTWNYFSTQNLSSNQHQTVNRIPPTMNKPLVSNCINPFRVKWFLVLTWVSFNRSMDIWLHTLCRCNHLGLGVDKWYHPTLYWSLYMWLYISMLRLNLYPY